jgi:two-component system, chemotaxis family, chemotaxis protein CheY
VIRVFLCDDVPDLRFLFRLALEERDGVEVVGEAGDGAAGVEAIASLKPDIVLLDLAMPVMDGLQAIPLIRECSPATRIIVLSGFGDGPAADSARALGIDRFVDKSTSLEEISAAVLEVGAA